MMIRPSVRDQVQVIDGSLRGGRGVVTRETTREGVVLFEVEIEGDVHWVPEPWLAVSPPDEP